jgi:hypothetical protein
VSSSKAPKLKTVFLNCAPEQIKAAEFEKTSPTQSPEGLSSARDGWGANSMNSPCGYQAVTSAYPTKFMQKTHAFMLKIPMKLSAFCWRKKTRPGLLAETGFKGFRYLLGFMLRKK